MRFRAACFGCCGVVAKRYPALQPLACRRRLGVGDGAVSRSSHPGDTRSWISARMEDGMTIRAILTVAIGVALLTSGGCQEARTIGDDFSRAFSSQPTSQSRSVAA